MRFRRTIHQLVVDIITELVKNEQSSISDIVTATNTNSDVIKRWLEIIETIQHAPQIGFNGSKILVNDTKFRIRIHSTRRYKRVATRFLIFRDSEREISHDYYDIQFELSNDDNFDILLLDQIEATDLVMESSVHLTTDQEGSIPMPMWNFYKLCHYLRFHKAISHFLRVVQMDKALSICTVGQSSVNSLVKILGDCNDPQTWITLAEEKKEVLLKHDTGRIFLSRLGFFIGSHDLFIDIGDKEEPWEARFWQVMVVLSNLQLSQEEIRKQYTEFLSTLTLYHPLMVPAFEVVTGMKIGAQPLKQEVASDKWNALIHTFFHSLNEAYYEEEKIAIALQWYKALDSEQYPFFYHWLVSLLEKKIQSLCWPNVQLSWINTLNHVTRRTFGPGELHLKRMAELIRRSFLVGNFYAVKLFISQLQSSYDISERTLYSDDINLLLFLVTLSARGCQFSNRSRYPIVQFFSALGLIDEVTIREVDNYSGISWVLNVEQRRILEQVLTVISVVLKEHRVKAVIHSIEELGVSGEIKQLIALLFLGLPEFGMGVKIKSYKKMIDFIKSNDNDTTLSSLLLGRLLLSIKADLAVEDYIISKVQKTCKEIIRTDKNLRDENNLELIYTALEIGRRYDKNDLVTLVTDLPYTKKIRRVSTLAIEARTVVFQRLLPRRGRKASEIPKVLFDLQTDFTVKDLYKLLLIREITVSVMKELEM